MHSNPLASTSARLEPNVADLHAPASTGVNGGPSRRRARCCALEGRSAAEVAYLGPGQPGIEHHGAWPEGVAGTLRRPCLKRQRGGLGQCRWAVLASITHKVQRAL